jgi:hypothetical protein
MEPHVEVVESEAPMVRTWCIVYDVETNDVIHIHEHLAYDADGSPNQDDLARDALAFVSSDFDRARLAVAHPRSDIELSADLDYTVEPKTATVVARPAEVKKLRPSR